LWYNNRRTGSVLLIGREFKGRDDERSVKAGKNGTLKGQRRRKGEANQDYRASKPRIEKSLLFSQKGRRRGSIPKDGNRRGRKKLEREKFRAKLLQGFNGGLPEGKRNERGKSEDVRTENEKKG